MNISQLNTIVPLGAQMLGGEGGGMMQLLIPVLLFGGMWFLMIAPQRKKQKQHEKMLQGLKSGDEVITTSGIYGVINQVRPDRFVLKIADSTKIEIVKSAVQGFVPTKEDAK